MVTRGPEVISSSLDVDFIHGDIQSRSCKNVKQIELSKCGACSVPLGLAMVTYQHSNQPHTISTTVICFHGCVSGYMFITVWACISDTSTVVINSEVNVQVSAFIFYYANLVGIVIASAMLYFVRPQNRSLISP